MKAPLCGYKRLKSIKFFKRALIKKLIFLSFSFLGSNTLIAQNRLPEPILFPTPDFNEIYEIEQDSLEILWLATDRGLFCFDGRIFRKIIHSPGGVSAVDNTRINDLYMDRQGQKLWIATVSGASALDLRTETFHQDYTFYDKEEPRLTDGECTSIFKDRAGAVWFGIQRFGLIRLEKDSITEYPFKTDGDEKLIKPLFIYISQIAQDLKEDSTLWLATGKTGLIRFNKKTGLYHQPDQSKLEEEMGEPTGGLTFTSLLLSGEKILLGNKWRKICVVYDLRTSAFKILKTDRSVLIEVMQDRSPETCWIHDRLKGIHMLDVKNERIRQTFPISDKVEALSGGFLASPEQIWMNANKGLLMYDLTAYQVENHIFPKDESGGPGILLDILEKEDGSGFWVALADSEFIYEYDRETRTSRGVAWPKKETSRPGHFIRLQNSRILAVAPFGLYELRDGELIYLPLLEDLAVSKLGFGRVVQDKTGYLWLSTRWGGLYRWNFETGEYCNYLSGDHTIEAVFKDRDGNIWMPYSNGFAVYHFQKDTIFKFPYEPWKQKTAHYPDGFVQDAEGQIWISDTRAGGLMKIDPARLEEGIQERYVANNGPRSNQMQELAIDQKRRIWAVTLDGLQVFDPADSTFTLHGESAGFRLRTPDQTYFNFAPSYLTRLSSGELLVGYHEGGFAIFHPDSLQGNREIPRPYLISFKANGEPVAKGVHFENVEIDALTYDQNQLEFEFSAVVWRESKKVAFKYQLKAANDKKDNWIQTNGSSVSYDHLSPGAYTFQLRTINSDGKELKKPLEIHFKIRAPWYWSHWSKILYLLLIFGLTYASYRFLLKRRLEQAEAFRLRELDLVKTKLYTNITHEFRTPLTIILGMADQIKVNPKDWYNEGLTMIKRNGASLLRLVDQMLDLSKLEAGSLPVNMIQSDIVNYLQYITESFQSYAQTKDIRLHFQCEAESLLMDYDPDKLLNIVSNLLTNAIKYTPEGGDVYLVVAIREAGTKDSSLYVKVKDTGIGIAQDRLPFIFDRFYQAASVDSQGAFRKSGGTGIGLALTKEMVKLLGGEISVKSKLGEGSEFSFYLPVRRTAPFPDTGDYTRLSEGLVPYLTESYSGEKALSAPEEEQQEKPLLLIIEDHRDVVRYLSACLNGSYRLQVAYDGKEGMEKAKQLIPDLIISDVMMPEADGFEVCQTLKKDVLTSHIPLVLLTAKADFASKIEGLERGADAYLAKPFHKEELLVRLRKLIELRRRLQEYYGTIPRPTPSAKPETALDDSFILEVQNILEAHLGDENFGVPELCKALGVSRTQLYRKFSALTGKSVGRYFRSLRLHKARNLLQTTNLNISEIAFETGFKDPAYFTRTFKEEFGKNPSETRG